MLNLLLKYREMGGPLLAALRAPDAAAPRAGLLDPFLLAAGMNQVLEDYLHRDVCSLRRAARHLPQLAGDRVGHGVAAAALAAHDAGLHIRGRRAQERALVARQVELAALVRSLAERVAGDSVHASLEGAQGGPATALLQRAEAVVRPRGGAPRSLNDNVLRLAHCFRSFDQRPEDCRRIVDRLTGRFPDRGRPVLVVGLRTSGSYLGPLCGAFLTMSGYDVDVMTFRPGQPWLEAEAERVARAVREARLVCLVDDPPRSGSQLADAAEAFERAGIARRSLVLLFQLFGSAESLPARLRSYQTVALGWDEWSVHDDLTPTAVHRTLARVLPGRRIARWPAAADGDMLVGAIADVEAVGPPPTSNPPGRGHVSALFRARLVDERTGNREEHYVHVKGAGIGYFGAHSLAVAGALSAHLPPVYALENGLLYVDWLPEQWRLCSRGPGEEPAIASGIAAYVAARRRALAVGEDVSERLVGRGAVWEILADMLSDAFGRAKYAARPLVNRTAKRLVRPSWPSIVDGSMSLAHWFAPPTHEAAPNGLLKVDFDVRAFSNEDAYCYDALFDLASAAADDSEAIAFGAADDQFGEQLRHEFARAVGEAVPDERWLLYQLVYHHQVARGRDHRHGAVSHAAPRDLLARETAMSRAYQRYFGGLYFADLTPPRSGGLCAIDVDWVLESRWLTFPVISPAGALALRALARHGYRPVLATGRSLPEVQDRCIAYRLAGGVAEHGAVVYEHGSCRVRSMLSAADCADMDALRAELARTPGVWLDPRHQHGIRAHCIDSHGRRSGLNPDVIQRVLARTGAAERFTAHVAPSQTDFTPAHIDKGTGLRTLAGELAAGDVARSGPLLAFAIGDSASDLPMLELAGRAFAPANADRALRVGRDRSVQIEVMTRPTQAGLLRAVSSFLGHAPRGCTTCAPPVPESREARLLISVLGALDGGGQEKLKQLCLLALREVVDSTVGQRHRVRRETELR
jgi:hydroxymethylpyrimidine pyrophosphatase-like HAD family hydrolase